MKESYLVQVAEYAKHNKIVSKTTFAWWVQAVLRRGDRNIKKVKTGYLRKTHKYRIKIPRTVDLLAEGHKKAMKNIRISFKFNDANEILITYQKYLEG